MSIPVGAERRFSFSQWLQTGFDLILACKLVMLATSDESLRHSYPQIQSLCDTLDMAGVLKSCIDRQILQQSSLKSQSTGFDYLGWLQWIQEWFLRHCNGFTAQRHQDTAAPPTISANYVAPAVQTGMENLNNGELGFSEEMLSWPSYAELCAADNPFASWMDFNFIPM